MKRTQLAALLIAALSVGATAGALIQDASQQDAAPDMAAMMQAYEKAGAVTERHKALEPFAGTFDADFTMWMDPAMPPTTSKGTMTNTWTLGGRFLEHSYEGEFMGEPFQGRGIWGFDVAADRYTGLWIDNMSTCLHVSSGPVSEDGKIFRLQVTSTDPMTGEPKISEEVFTLESPDRHRMEMFEFYEGQRVRSMEIVYTRKR